MPAAWQRFALTLAAIQPVSATKPPQAIRISSAHGARASHHRHTGVHQSATFASGSKASAPATTSKSISSATIRAATSKSFSTRLGTFATIRAATSKSFSAAALATTTKLLGCVWRGCARC